MSAVDAVSARPERASGTSALAPLAGIFVAAALIGGLFLRAMTLGLRRDEQLYASPVSLLSDYEIYSGFFYNHMPGSAYFFHALGGATEGLGVLMTARLGVFVFWVLLVAAGGALLRRLTGSWMMTAFCLLTILTNEVFLGPAGLAGTNNFPTVALGFLGVLLFLRGVSEPDGAPWSVAAAGVALGLAASFKASGVAFVAPVAAAAFLAPVGLPFRARLRRSVLPLALGGVAAAVPALTLFAADPAGFLAHVVGYHTGPHAAYWAAHDGGAEDVAFSLTERAALLAMLFQSGAAAMTLFAIALSMLILAPRGGLARLAAAPGADLTVALAVLASNALLAMIPAPAFPQYFAPVFATLSLTAAVLFSKLGPAARDQMRLSLAAGCMVMLTLAAPRFGVAAAEASLLRNWTPVAVHRSGERLAALLEHSGAEGKVATLAPLYPLEGGLPVYAELATGQFAYRAAPYAAPELLAHYRTTSPDSIEAMLEADPPAALLLGYEPELERPMHAFADRRGYVLVEDFAISDRYGEGRVYLRPPAP
jgi:hypothetical protein